MVLKKNKKKNNIKKKLYKANRPKNNLVKQNAVKNNFINDKIRKFIIMILKSPFLLINSMGFYFIIFFKKIIWI